MNSTATSMGIDESSTDLGSYSKEVLRDQFELELFQKVTKSSPESTTSLSAIQKGNTVVRLPERSHQATQTALQEWEGYVVRVEEGTFISRIQDLTNEDQIENEEIEFLTEDLSEDDLKLLKPGAVFRWTIGYLKSGGSKKRFSHIIFRRFPILTKSTVAIADKKAKELASRIVWE